MTQKLLQFNRLVPHSLSKYPNKSLRKWSIHLASLFFKSSLGRQAKRKGDKKSISRVNYDPLKLLLSFFEKNIFFTNRKNSTVLSFPNCFQIRPTQDLYSFLALTLLLTPIISLFIISMMLITNKEKKQKRKSVCIWTERETSLPILEVNKSSYMLRRRK
jgi:hypothetical protein